MKSKLKKYFKSQTKETVLLIILLQVILHHTEFVRKQFKMVRTSNITVNIFEMYQRYYLLVKCYLKSGQWL